MRMHAGVPAVGGAPLIVEERIKRKLKKQIIEGSRRRRNEITKV